jgi:predicted secreted Zn-dependent protease
MNDDIPRIATVHTDGRITLQSLKNTKIHKYLIEKIRKTAIPLEKRNWTNYFTCIKVHSENYGNELADKLAKESARNDDISFNRIPKNEMVPQVRDQHCQVAKPMKSHYKMASNETIFPNHQGQTDHQNQFNAKLHGSTNSSR